MNIHIKANKIHNNITYNILTYDRCVLKLSINKNML